MNWMTHKTCTYSKLSKDDKEGADFCCELAEEDTTLIVASARESDSFGTVGLYLMCPACKVLADKADEEAIECCFDCNTEYPAKEGIQWKSYDHYPAQGDEPIFICNTCCGKERHKKRVADDDHYYRMEHGYDDD